MEIFKTIQLTAGMRPLAKGKQFDDNLIESARIKIINYEMKWWLSTKS